MVYDGECRVCRAAAAAFVAWDRAARFTVVPFGHPVADAALAAIPREERASALRCVTGGRVESAAGAVAVMLRGVPGGRLLLALGAARLYPRVAARRGRLSRLAPDVAAPVRVAATPPGGTSS